VKTKHALKSKTVHLNVFGLLGLMVPGADHWISSHPRQVLLFFTAGNLILRLISHERLDFKMPKYFASIFLLAFLCMGVSQCAQIPIDRSVSAAEGNDYVVVLSGYGNKSTKGYLFAQTNEKASTDGVLTITFPKVSCKRDSCVRFQFFRKDGSSGYAGALKSGETSTTFKLSDIVGHTDPVVPTDEGEYRIVSQVFYLGTDGTEYSMIGNGFVRVNVLSELYRPVACDDPNIAWKVQTVDKCEAQFTSVFRSALCGGGCK
jgi:hypothetical protein